MTKFSDYLEAVQEEKQGELFSQKKVFGKEEPNFDFSKPETKKKFLKMLQSLIKTPKRYQEIQEYLYNLSNPDLKFDKHDSRGWGSTNIQGMIDNKIIIKTKDDPKKYTVNPEHIEEVKNGTFQVFTKDKKYKSVNQYKPKTRKDYIQEKTRRENNSEPDEMAFGHDGGKVADFPKARPTRKR